MQSFRIRILAFSHFLSEKDGEELAAKLTSLEDVLENCRIISLHAALTFQTRGMTGEK